MQPRDIRHLITLSAPAITADARRALVAASRPSEEADRNVGQVWQVALDADDSAASTEGAGDAAPAPSRRLTRGTADASPQLSPAAGEGAEQLLAFLRPDADGTAQIHVIDPGGGEAVQVTDAPLGVTEFTWSPDARTLVFRARVPEQGRYGTVEGIVPGAEPARRITTTRWHANGLGYMLDRPTHVFAVDAPDPAAEPSYAYAPSPGSPASPPARVPAPARQLTSGPDDHTAIVVDAAGERVLAVRDQAADPQGQLRDLRTRLVSLPLDGEGEEQLLLDERDGFTIHALGMLADATPVMLASQPVEGRDAIAPDVALWLLAEQGPLRLTDPEELELAAAGGTLATVGDEVLVHHRTRGRVHLHLVGRDGSRRPAIQGDVEVGGARAVRRGEEVHVLASAATPTSAGELLRAVVPARAEAAAPEAPAAQQLTDVAAPLRASGLVTPVELELTGRDGYPLHGWAAVPEGEGLHPVILMIHGGPHAQYGVAVFDEVQTLVDAGYAVVYGNPRGSAGYGREHGRSIRRRMGTLDFQDVIDLLEGALSADARGELAPGGGSRLDPERLGVMGGSYGGYLTAWTIAHDHRFAAAIVERGFLDPASFQGTSDIGSYFGDEYVGTDPEAIRRQSPFAHVDQVRTPTFVIHSEQDLRCPLEQGTRYYTALRRAGVEAEMLIFPGEHHELTRSGRPRHRLQRFDAVLEWWRSTFES